MDWNQSIDIYCERRGPEFWAEPINAICNISFIIAALLAMWLYNKRLPEERKKDTHILILIILAFIVGVGSFIFHTFATLWAMYVDVIPIYTFALYYTIIGMWKIVKFNRLQTIISLILIASSFVMLAIFVPSDAFNGSFMYFPFVFMLAAFGIYLQYKKSPAAKHFFCATGVLIIALLFRTIDIVACPYVPFGTHFLWHLISGLMFYILLRILILTQVQEEYSL